jgi:hypothetical protein
VEHVHIVVGTGGAVAAATAVARRYPRTVRISLHAAADLVAAGAPFTVSGPPARGARGA